MAGFLAIVGILEIIGGVAALLTAKAVFVEIEGSLLVGFGFLTLAVVFASTSIVAAVDLLRITMREARIVALEPEPTPLPSVKMPNVETSGYVRPSASPGWPQQPGNPNRREPS
jgi:hypothetical protein